MSMVINNRGDSATMRIGFKFDENSIYMLFFFSLLLSFFKCIVPIDGVCCNSEVCLPWHFKFVCHDSCCMSCRCNFAALCKGKFDC